MRDRDLCRTNLMGTLRLADGKHLPMVGAVDVVPARAAVARRRVRHQVDPGSSEGVERGGDLAASRSHAACPREVWEDGPADHAAITRQSPVAERCGNCRSSGEAYK